MMEKVTTTWLELSAGDRINLSPGYKEKMEVRQVENDAFINFILFAGVGLPWRWYSRLDWTFAEYDDYFSRADVTTWLAFSGRKLAGYYELISGKDGETEIKFIGLLPRHIGTGLGGTLLSHAVSCALENGASRIWLHTCTKDSEHALDNYIARGFRIFRKEEKMEQIPDRDELIQKVSVFFARYYDHYSSGVNN
jgi:GNAT superfamily N-acetyltransferase